MNEKLLRVGTTYIPVQNVEISVEWYSKNLGATVNYKDQNKAIIDLANQSFFLVRSIEGQTANFIDTHLKERFSMTFEVNGIVALESIHQQFIANGMEVGEIENRGHAGRNFVFSDLDGNLFDVWSELSSAFLGNAEKQKETGS